MAFMNPEQGLDAQAGGRLHCLSHVRLGKGARAWRMKGFTRACPKQTDTRRPPGDPRACRHLRAGARSGARAGAVSARRVSSSAEPPRTGTLWPRPGAELLERLTRPEEIGRKETRIVTTRLVCPSWSGLTLVVLTLLFSAPPFILERLRCGW